MLTLLALLLHPYAGEARADSGFENTTYIGLQLGSSNTSVNDYPADVELSYAMLQAGIWLHPDITLEVRAATGIGDDSDAGIDFEVEGLYGLYGMYHLHLGDALSVYGALGATQGSIKASTRGDSEQESERGLSYGVGARFAMFSVEVMRYLDTDDLEIDALSIGYQYNFD